MNDGQPEQRGYVSYLMRLWRAPVDGGHTWRASLEEPHSRKIPHFKELSSLFAFLQAQTGRR